MKASAFVSLEAVIGDMKSQDEDMIANSLHQLPNLIKRIPGEKAAFAEIVDEIISCIMEDKFLDLRNDFIRMLHYLLDSRIISPSQLLYAHLIEKLLSFIPSECNEILKILMHCIEMDNEVVQWVILHGEMNFIPVSNDSLAFLNYCAKCAPIDIDIQVILQKIIRSICCDEISLEPMQILDSMLILFQRNLLEIDEFYKTKIQELVQLIGSQEAFKKYQIFHVNFEDEIGWLFQCLQNKNCASSAIYYLKSRNVPGLPIDVIKLLLEMFPEMNYNDKANIFLILEPYYSIIHEPKMLKISSEFISESGMGMLALRTTYLGFVSMPEDNLAETMHYIYDSIDSLESISYASSIDGVCASLLLQAKVLS